jgi:hypothetical protein
VILLLPLLGSRKRWEEAGNLLRGEEKREEKGISFHPPHGNRKEGGNAMRDCF